MTLDEWLGRRAALLRLVIYDCDGVLVDSEVVASRVCAAALTEIGWPMDGPESQRLFTGMSIGDMVPIIETHLGRPVPPTWVPRLVDRLTETMASEAVLVDHACEVLEATTALGLDWRIASNSGPEELAVKFARTGLSDLVSGRVHSAREVIARGGRGKPAPDLFLAAADASGVSPAACVVVEDSRPGVTGARAAGMEVLAYVPHGGAAAFEALGAMPLRSLRDLPALLERMIRA